MWILQWTIVLQLLWLLAGGVSGLEVGIPERYLRPRDFNPHPYFGGGGRTLSLQDLPEHPPYSLFPRPPSRGEEATAPIQFPRVPESSNEITPEPPRLKPTTLRHPLHLSSNPVNLKKKYAFSYAVRDQYSGDDFSHSQAATGTGTKGEYRVKLPDGRLQIVTYTADHTGYRADVRYDENNLIEETPIYAEVPQYEVQAQYKAQVPQYNVEVPQYKVEVPQYKSIYKPVFYNFADLGGAPGQLLKPRPNFTPIHEHDESEYRNIEQNPDVRVGTLDYSFTTPQPQSQKYYLLKR